jgi:hypothetical protein
LDVTAEKSGVIVVVVPPVVIVMLVDPVIGDVLVSVSTTPPLVVV